MQWTLQHEVSGRNSGYAGTKSSPAAVGAAIVVHVGAVVAFLLMPANQYIPTLDVGMPTHAVPLPPEPPKQEPSHAKKVKPNPTQPHKTEVNQTSDPIFPPTGGDIFDTHLKGYPFDGGGTTIVDPPHWPVLVDARPDPARIGDFQPEYPGAMIRQQVEGDVTVRIHITAQGRVDAVELVKASNDAFWKVTRAQALSRWRFRPATRDGEPVDTTRVMTVHFRLSEI